MSYRTRRLPLLLLGAAILGCEDPVSPVAEADPLPAAEQPASTSVTVNTSGDFEEPPIIEKATIDVGFSMGYAWAQAYMQFVANWARQTADLWVRKGTSTVAHRTGESHGSWIAPWRRSLWTHATARVPETCGHVADAKGRHEAASQIPVNSSEVVRLWRTVKTSNQGTYQPSCATSCANQALAYGNECDDRYGSTGGSTKTTGTSGSDGLECHTEKVVIYIGSRKLYEGPALVCE